MNPNDPFSALGGERTIIKPRLGKPAPSAIQSLDDLLGPVSPRQTGTDAPNQQTKAAYSQILEQYRDAPAASRNQLLANSSPILRLTCMVGNSATVTSPRGLAEALSKSVSELDQRLEQAGRGQAERLSMRYLLCTFIDEKAANTPWGGSGQWASHSLLLQFFSETWGGEKVFALTQKLMQDPIQNRDLLEVMAVVISLGFKGKYKVEAGGDIALAALRHQLFQLVRRSPAEPDLHPAFWRSRAPKGQKKFQSVPLWLPVSALSVLACSVFLGLYFNLNRQSDEAFAAITAVSFPRPEFPVAQAAPVQITMGLELPRQLQQEIMDGVLTLKQIGNKSTVILVGDGLFDSGSAELSPKALPLVEKVAKELALHPGQITVTGYTDNQPIRSIRFPSNWQLSAERAEHVGQRIAKFLPNTAIATEGAGAANPIGPNTTPQGRALNRRVEITLLHAQ